MICRKCGRELRAGAQRCPYCGTVVPAPGRRTETAFNWELKESSGSANARPREKKSELTFDWNTDKRANTGASTSTHTGRAGFQEENRWREPEEARQLFTFDKAHEKLQKQVNQKVDTIAAEKPAPVIERERRDDLFVLPSDMTMDDFSDLLGDSIVQESDSVLVVNRQAPPLKPQQRQTEPSRQTPPAVEPMKTAEPVLQQSAPETERPVVIFPPPETTPAPYAPVQTAAPKPAAPVQPPIPPVQEFRPVREIRPPKRKKQRSPEDQAYDPFKGQTFLQVPEIPAFLSGVRREREPALSFVSEPESADVEKASSEFGLGTLWNLIGNAAPEESAEERVPSLTAIDPGYTPEEEERAIANFQNLINAEEAFSASVARFTFMSEEESEKASQAWQRWEELSNEPELSFQSLEEEYRESKGKSDSASKPVEKDTLAEDSEEASAESRVNDGTAAENVSVSSEAEIEKAPVKDETETPETDKFVAGEEAEEKAEDEAAASAGKVRKAVDLVRKTAGRAAAVAAESVRSLDSEEGEDDEELDRGVFTGLSLSMEEPEDTASGRSSSAGRGKKKPRELNIRINEPTGTQVKVRTEEVELSEQAVNLRDTQQVDFGKLKEGPKSVKVQVEVNHTSSNSSVEVTRSDDGSTVVRTVEGGTEKEHLYDASGEDLLYRGPEEEAFWQRKEVPATKMTLEDIFSPEMMDFMGRWESEEEQHRAKGLETVVRAPDLSSEEAMEQILVSEPETEEEPAETGITEKPEAEEFPEESAVDAEASVEESMEESIEAKSAESAGAETENTVTETESETEPETDTETVENQDTDEAAVSEDVESASEPSAAEAEVEAGTEAGKIQSGQEQTSEESSEETRTTETLETPADEKTEPYGNLSAAAPSVHTSEKIEEMMEAEADGQDETPVQVGEEGRFKRAGKINFKYKKMRAKPEAIPVEADSEPEETIPGFPEEPVVERVEEEPEEGELQGLFESLTSIRNRIAEAIDPGEEEESRVAEEKEKAAAKTAPAVREKEPEADVSEESVSETKEESRWSAASIMKIVIYVLLVAIIIEFVVIGTRLFFPNSQGAVLIHRIEQKILGEDILSTISTDSFTLDGAEVVLPDLDQPEEKLG